jgi:hypothetical protein
LKTICFHGRTERTFRHTPSEVKLYKLTNNFVLSGVKIMKKNTGEGMQRDTCQKGQAYDSVEKIRIQKSSQPRPKYTHSVREEERR